MGGGRFVPFSVLQRGSTRMNNYVYFRDNCIFHKDFIIFSSN